MYISNDLEGFAKGYRMVPQRPRDHADDIRFFPPGILLLSQVIHRIGERIICLDRTDVRWDVNEAGI